MNAIEHLEHLVWKRPDSYGGFSPDGDYCVLSRTRDSLLLDESNWDAACNSLCAEAYDEGQCGFIDRPNVYHWRAGHWACGWVEYLMVRADAPESIREEAGEIVCSLADYPILNESDYSDREFNAVCNYWEHCSVSDRVDYLQRAGLSIFAARRDTLPEDCGRLFDTLREGF
jgi:hypothetical protein